MANSSFRLGFAGKQYGLVKAPPILKQNNIFEEDDQDEAEKVKLQKQREQEKKMKKAQQEQEKIMAENPEVYDYDGLYDEMKNAEDDRALRKKTETNMSRKPKYMADILKRVDERKREQDVVQDKMIQKEKEKEEGFGTEMFVTSAYKEQLKKNKEWELEEARREAAVGDATKSKSMTGFYANLLKDNVAIGTSKKPQPTPAPQTATPPPETSVDLKDVAAKVLQERRSKSTKEETPKETSPRSSEKKSSRSSPSRSRSRSPRRNRRSRSRSRSRSPKREHKRERSPSAPKPVSFIQLQKEMQTNAEIEEEEKKKKWEEEQAKKLVKKTDDKTVADAKARFLARKAEMAKELAAAREQAKFIP